MGFSLVIFVRTGISTRVRFSNATFACDLGAKFRCHHQENSFSLFWETAKSSHLSFVVEFSKRYEIRVMKTQQEANKALVVEAFDTLFNKRDYGAAEKFWSPHYIQHSAHIGPGREGLFDLIKNTPATLKWEHGIILAQDDCVIVHSRYSGNGLPAAWIVVDIVRIKDGILLEHWDVIQDEATKEQSKSGNPMFGASFPS